MRTVEKIAEISESAYKKELKRPLDNNERIFLESEVERLKKHHQNMNDLVEKLEILKQKPVLLVDASDKATMGQPWIADIDQELIKYYIKIQTGLDNSDNLNYKEFVGLTYRHMFGFKPNDKRLEKISLVHGDKIPTDLSNYSLIIGTGGEINDFETQAQYIKTREDIRNLFSRGIEANIPFVVTCATHQILGQLLYEKNNGYGSIVDNLTNEDGSKITESGLVSFRLSEAGKTSFFTKDLEPQFGIMSNHGQYLRELPPGALSLAENDICKTQILEYKNADNRPIGLGFQAHPEISSAILLLFDRYERGQKIKQNIPLAEKNQINTNSTYTTRERVFPKLFSLIKN